MYINYKTKNVYKLNVVYSNTFNILQTCQTRSSDNYDYNAIRRLQPDSPNSEGLVRFHIYVVYCRPTMLHADLLSLVREGVEGMAPCPALCLIPPVGYYRYLVYKRI